jgi:hypothetical protein
VYDWSVKSRNNINTPTEDDANKRNVLTCTQGKCWFWTLCSIKCDILLPEFNDGIGNVRITWHCSSFASPVSQWKRNNAFCVYCWATFHCQEYNSIECCTSVLLWRICVAGNRKKQVFRLSYKVPDIFVRFFLPNLELFESILKTPVFKFYVIPSSGSRADARGQTDWHDEANIRFFCYSAAVPKNKPVILWIWNYDFKVEIAIGSSRRLFSLRCPWKPNWLVECLSVCQEGSHYISTVMQ